MNFDRILPNLYVGSFPHTTDDIDRLKAAGVTAVLNLQSDEDCDHLRIDWPRLAAYYAEDGIEARRVKIQDFDDDQLREKLPEAVRELDALLRAGRSVFVHCSGGVNRSPSVIIAYLHWVEGQDLDDAVSHVLSCRLCDPVVRVIRLASEDRQRGEG